MRLFWLSWKTLFISLGIAYAGYYIFLGGDEISYWARYNYVNGGLYLTYFHAILAYFTILTMFGFLEYFLQKILKHVLVKMSFGRTKQFPIIFNFAIKFFTLVKFLGALLVASYFVKENAITKVWLTNIQIVAITTLVVYFVSGISRILIEQKFRKLSLQKSSSAAVVKFGNKIIFIVIWLVGIGYILESFGQDLKVLLAGAGIGGLAIALSAQKSITNIFGAVTIVLNKPFNIGDYVNINGQEGTVKDIGLSYVTLTDRAGHQVMMPNENIITSSIANFSVRESRRVDFIIGVVYSTSLEKVKLAVELIENLLKTYLDKQMITDDIRVTFDMFNAFSLDIKVTYFSLEKTLLAFNHQKQEINLEIKKIFSEAGIEMAFPTSNMIIHNETLSPETEKKLEKISAKSPAKRTKKTLS